MEESFVIRNQVKLSCKGSHVLVHAAEKHAQAIGCPMCIAVVDEGGNLLAFSRMDGARIGSIEIALTKARSAARRMRPTQAEGGGKFEAGVLVALMSQLNVTMVPGGFPIQVDGVFVGGIGVSSGTSEQDCEVAQAGINALLGG